MGQKSAGAESQAGPAKCYAAKFAVGDAEPEQFLAGRGLPGRTFREREIQPASNDEDDQQRVDKGCAKCVNNFRRRFSWMQAQEFKRASCEDGIKRDDYGDRNGEECKVQDGGRESKPKSRVARR